jgi:hypothetical protein
MLSFHHVREALIFVSSQEIIILQTMGKLSQHWGYSQIKERLNSLLFWRGDTANVSSNMVDE